MNTTIRTTIACLTVAGVSIAATTKTFTRLTPQRVAELTAPSDAPPAKNYTVAITGLKTPWFHPGQTPAVAPSDDHGVHVTLPAEKPQAIIEVIREFRFPTAFEPPEAADGGARGLTAPTTPAAFETINTGWTIRLSAKPHGKLVAVYGVADYVEPEMVAGGYGAIAGPIYSEQGKLISPNVIQQPKFQTTSTRFHIFAVPGESYEVTLYRGAKAEKHSVTLTAE